MQNKKITTMAALGLALLFASQTASAITLEVTITNNAPAGGVYLTPVWVGFHDGSFDSYDSGAAAAPALEAISEDGNTGPISDVFSGTLAGGAVNNRVQGTVGGAPIAPGQTVTFMVDVSSDGANTYFSYASMVLASSDYFVANGDALAHSIADIFNGIVNQVSFNIGTPGSVNDAGTEVNDFATSAGNGLFGIPGGQTGPNQGADENGTVQSVVGDPFAAFLNPPAMDLSLFNFNDAGLYGNGIATITISAVPVPAALPLFAAGLGMLGLLRRGRRHNLCDSSS